MNNKTCEGEIENQSEQGKSGVDVSEDAIVRADCRNTTKDAEDADADQDMGGKLAHTTASDTWTTHA